MLNDKKCILVADDEQTIVRALKDLLVAKGYEILCAYDGEEAVEQFVKNSTNIDLILLDVMMPKLDGYGVVSEIRKAKSLVPVIMLTARSEEYDELNAFNSGVDDYITKPFSPSVLLARIDAILRRVGKDNSSEIEVGNLKILSNHRSVFVDGEEISLTHREYDLLYFLVINKSIAFSRERLLNNIWGYNYDGSARTVDTHIKQLRTKLGNKAPYIKTIHCVGYQFEVE